MLKTVKDINYRYRDDIDASDEIKLLIDNYEVYSYVIIYDVQYERRIGFTVMAKMQVKAGDSGRERCAFPAS